MTNLKQAALHRRILTALQATRYGEAEQLCQIALRQSKKDIQALAMLAQAHHQTGRDDEAIEGLKKCLAIDSKNFELRLALGQVYAQRGLYVKSLAQLDTALKLKPGLEEALITKGNVFERQGQYPRAFKLLTPFIESDNPPAGMVATYIRILTRDGKLDAAIELGERFAAGDHEPTLWTRDVYFALSKACEVSGQYEQSFEAGLKANSQLPVGFDPELHHRRIDMLIEVYSRSRLERLPTASETDIRPIFIVGMPRTGSTLVERIIHAHPDAFGAGEMSALPLLTDRMQMAIGSTLPFPQCIEDLDLNDIDTLAGSYLDELRRTAGRSKVIVDKQLGNFMHVGLIQILFPYARVLDCRRDPVDNCLSCFMERLTPASAPYATDLEHLGAYYREYERLMRHWQEALDVPLMTLSYEKLIDDQENQTRSLLEFCGLSWNDKCMRFFESKRHDNTLSYDQVRRPLYKASMGRAERFGSLLDPLRTALTRA